MLWFESPPGVGFSETGPLQNNTQTNDTVTADDNMAALVVFFSLFPELKPNEFFISGESYGGIYVPYLASKVLKYNVDNPTTKIKLQGFTVGNGLVS